ncbi:MAG: hypothetical protein CML66_07560 [Rhodobacteraceae bacterium]|nr:hypothetical protein [Paracoccaceae bacterium]MAY46139.1 hypothetical protein [Paracoccaceae bacterium]QEW22686.1 hypothetical protein LA6_004920 [Marinibacterium anthonyi]
MHIHRDNSDKAGSSPDGADVVSVMMPFADRAAAAAQVVLDSDDPEGPHQVRVGLRKARTGLKVFGRKDARARDLGNEARDIAAIVGRLRDLDAVRLDIVGPFLSAHADASGFAALDQALRDAAIPVRAEVRAMIGSGRLDAHLADLRDWIATHSGVRAEKRANKALKKRFRSAQGFGWRFAVLDPESRHAFRKELKKLRYTLDCGAWADGGAARKEFVKRLKAIQESLGAMNDAVVAHHVLDRLTVGCETAERAAAGQIMAALEARSETDIRLTAELWLKVEEAAPDWM